MLKTLSVYFSVTTTLCIISLSHHSELLPPNTHHPDRPGRTGTRIPHCTLAGRSRPDHNLLEEVAAAGGEADRILAEGALPRSLAGERWGKRCGRLAGNWRVVAVRRSRDAGSLVVGIRVVGSLAVGNRRTLVLESPWLAVEFRNRGRRPRCFRRRLVSRTIHRCQNHGRCRLRKTTGC